MKCGGSTFYAVSGRHDGKFCQYMYMNCNSEMKVIKTSESSISR